MPHIELTATETFHRQFSKVLKEKNASKYREQIKKEEIKEKEVVGEPNEAYVYHLTTDDKKPHVKVEKNKHKNALVQTLKIDYKDIAVQINQEETKKHNDKIKPVEINEPVVLNEQTEETEPIKKSNVYKIKHIPDENDFGPYCPPALHYNSRTFHQSSKKAEKIIDEKMFAKNRIQYLNQAARHIHIEEINNDSNNDEQISDETELKDYFVNEKPTEKKTLNEINLDQMPMIKCLFEEINLIKNMLEAKNESKMPLTPKQNKEMKSESNLTGILRQKPNQVKSFSKKEATIQSANRVSHSQKVENVQKKIVQNNFEQESNIKKEKKPPLKYGSTNSHRMRVLKNNPNKINEINKKHEILMSQIKENIDSFNLSNNQVFNESLGNNLDRGKFLLNFL